MLYDFEGWVINGHTVFTLSTHSWNPELPFKNPSYSPGHHAREATWTGCEITERERDAHEPSTIQVVQVLEM